jgi:branched-chain amino acid transport system substrate-binding protein
MGLQVQHPFLAMAVLLAAGVGPVGAQPRYDPGASDTEIRIGNIVPYSGPASAYGVYGKTAAAYFDKINAEGGINGRRIKFISYDDAYSPPKAVEQARKLVESDEVLLIFNSLGTPTNSAIRSYMNAKRVPQLFAQSGASKWNDPDHFPWTMGWVPSYQTEARVHARYLLHQHPDGKIAVLYQNDDIGKDYLMGLRDGLAGKIPIVAQLSYETADPTVDSQIVALRASGADVFVDVATAKFATQAIRKSGEIGWKPLHLVDTISRSVAAVLRPAGFDYAQGILAAAYTKDPTDPTWSNDPGFKDWSAFMDRYFPAGDRTDINIVNAYTAAQLVVRVLQQCGNDLERTNIMRQAASLRNVELPMLLPGIVVNTAPDDFAPVKQMQMTRFSGDHWEVFGPVMSGTPMAAVRSRRE